MANQKKTRYNLCAQKSISSAIVTGLSFLLPGKKVLFPLPTPFNCRLQFGQRESASQNMASDDFQIFNKKFQFREVTEEFKCCKPFKNQAWQVY